MNYKWQKSEYPKKKGKTVFTTFACGGGSSMGYKMAGFDVIGANDIDPQMAKIYKHNHNPKHFFLCPIGDLLKMDLPDELYNLDILDGSPPCSTFSMAGSREKNWKKKKKFREGQAEQHLSDLFFDWIALLKKLQPKIGIAENVKGMLAGNAIAYTKMIMSEIEKAGYDVQLFLLNGVTMGLPQARERVFFICRRKDLKLPEIMLKFNEKPVTYADLRKQATNIFGKALTNPLMLKLWEITKAGNTFKKSHYSIATEEQLARKSFTGSYFNTYKLSPHKPLPTITASRGGGLLDFQKPYHVSDEILCLASSFPTDYDYLDIDPKYLTGMSVPPKMVYEVSTQVYKQLLSLL